MRAIYGIILLACTCSAQDLTNRFVRHQGKIPLDKYGSFVSITKAKNHLFWLSDEYSRAVPGSDRTTVSGQYTRLYPGWFIYVAEPQYGLETCTNRWWLFNGSDHVAPGGNIVTPTFSSGYPNPPNILPPKIVLDAVPKSVVEREFPGALSTGKPKS